MLRPLLLSLTLVLAACGGATSGQSLFGGGSDGELLSCGDATWSEDGLDDLAPLDTLPEDVLAATDDVGEPVVDRSLPWRVAEETETDVVLVRELGPDDPEAVDGATHAALTLFQSGGVNNPPGSWLYASGDVCTPRLAGGNEGERAEVRLADTPSPNDTTLQLLVMERACASGQSAEGRIRADDVTLTEDEVRLRISVVPPSGLSQTCQGNPWTPFEVDLDEPLGDRTVVDANLVPPQELVVGTAEPEPFDPEAEPLDDAVARALEFTPWPDYTAQVETTCFCPAGTYEVVVREGEVVARRPADPRIEGWLPAADFEAPNFSDAPSLSELQQRLAEAYEDDPTTITELVVDETGAILRVAFDPTQAEDDDVAYRVFADVDSPGDPIDQDR